MNYYVKLIITVLVVVALAQFVPEMVNAFLLLVIAGVIIMRADQYAALVKSLNL